MRNGTNGRGGIPGLWALAWMGLLLAGGVGRIAAQVAPGTVPKAPPGFELKRWAREPMLRSPVALSYDDQGRLFVVETARRSTVDIDIRSHPSWLVEDLANQSVDDLRRFFRERMAPERSPENTGWLTDRNEDGSHDWRDLLEVKEKVHRLEDRSGAGVADTASVLAEGFNEEVNGVVAGVMPWEGDVFVTVYPDLWRLRDEDGDGVAERKEILFRGFGVHAAFDGHDLHGLEIGPEGKIYFSIGDNGFSVTNREGRVLHHPNTGGVLRMNPDGSDLEVFATGLRNPQEIAFDEFGNMFAVDNDGDLADERERFVFVAEGSDSGWRLNWQFREAGWARETRQPNYNPWIDERMWVPHFPGQPAHITPALSNYSVGPGSLKYNPGTALDAAHRNHFFLIQFPVAKVTAFRVRPRGAGFEMHDEHVFVSGMMASAVNFSPDGALAIADWDGLWSPSGKGSIWKVDDPAAAKSAERAEVQAWLRQGARGRSLAELERALGHADRRIRQRAQFESVRRGAFDLLRRVAGNEGAPVLARLHALWGLGQGKSLQEGDVLPWTAKDVHVRAQAAKVAGDARLKSAVPHLVQALTDVDAAVRFQAGLALGKIGDAGAVGGLVSMLAANGNEDAFLRHAGVMGLVGTASPAALTALTAHGSAAARLAAVVALRRLGASEVSVFLDDANPAVRAEVVRAIHDDRTIAGALPALAALAERSEFDGEPGLWRRTLNANLRGGTEEGARRLSRIAADGRRSEDVRLEALECLAAWGRTPALDRVQGHVWARGPKHPLRDEPAWMRESPEPTRPGTSGIREAFGAVAKDAGPRLRQALVRIVLENGIEVDPRAFSEWAAAADQPPTVRAQALEWLARRDAPTFGDALRRALDSGSAELRLAALRLEAEKRPEDHLARVEREFDGMTLREKQGVLSWVERMPGDRAGAWIERQFQKLRSGRVAAELALDVWEAAAARKEPGLARQVETFEREQAASGAWTRFRPTLAGGDAAQGREIFRSHPNAQCVRCHDAGGEGRQVGPVLKGIGSRLKREEILESILEPSARIADGYATTQVQLRDGEELDGVRLSESANELVLRLANGSVRRLSPRDILHRATSTVSTMPPMGEVLNRFDIRDLIEYLAGER